MKALLCSIFMVLAISSCAPSANFSNLENRPLYGLQAQLVAKEGKGPELSKILLQAASLMKSAEGCHLYTVGLDKTNLDMVWVTEIWTSKEHHDKSLSTPGVKELIGKAIPILKENPKGGLELQIIGGLGVK